ncbi:MAG: hypothetical protein IJT91_03470 [Clostridia bacterium]|nr:hypothetical protein [Clostridia bacterium]
MKRLITIILAAAMLFTLASCGTTNEPTTSDGKQSATESTSANNGTPDPDTVSETGQTTDEPDTVIRSMSLKRNNADNKKRSRQILVCRGK